MPTLKILANSTSNQLTVDLSAYLNLQEDKGLDPANPEFSNRVWSRSILREGATLAMEQMTEKETTWPLLLNQPNTTALDTLVQQINQAITTPGAIATWQDDGASQPTTFDLLSGVLEIQYTYRKAQKFWLAANLRLFSQPLGRTVGPRAYAGASGVGPLLMISPYFAASAGSLVNPFAVNILGASTQAGTAGYGGAPTGPSSGIFYSGSPSLAGDAPALLVMGYLANASPAQVASSSMLSLLPDGTYNPQMNLFTISGAQSRTRTGSVPGGTIYQAFAPGSQLGVVALSSTRGGALPLAWAGQHRVFALARASGTTAQLSLQSTLSANVTVASVAPGNTNLYDLGTLSFRASTGFTTLPRVFAAIPSVAGTGVGGVNCAVDVFGMYMLPDATTWFLPAASAPHTGFPMLVHIDDTLGEQGAAPNVAWLNAFIPTVFDQTGRFTPVTRGLVPRPDPRNGLPVLAILAGNDHSASDTYPYPLMSAQLQVQERTRYTLG